MKISDNCLKYTTKGFLRANLVEIGVVIVFLFGEENLLEATV